VQYVDNRNTQVNETLIRRALANSMRIRFRLGLFDDAATQPYRQLGKEAINDAAARDLNREASRQVHTSTGIIRIPAVHS